MPTLSKLLTRREPFVLRHPVLVSGICFGIVGAISTYLSVMVETNYSGNQDSSLITVAMMWGAMCATVSGAKAGRAILRDRSITRGRACMKAARAVLMAHLAFVGIPGVIAVAIVTMIWQFNAGGFALMVSLFLLVASVLKFGAITFALGCLTGVLLQTYRQRVTRPLGCKLHGLGAQV